MFRCRKLLVPKDFIVPCQHYAKDVKFGQNVKSLMLQGVDILTDAVAVTLGPKGRNVILEQKYGPPKITKDGVTVAKGIDLKNRFQNIGAKLVQNVAQKTNEEAGDGTTTATILARAIAREGFDNISKGANPVEVRNGVMIAVEAIKKKLKEMSKPVKTSKEIMQVASISANGDEVLGKLITDAMDRVGKDGVVVVKVGKTTEDGIEFQEGMKINKGFISPFFINSAKDSKVEFGPSLVLISQKKIFTTKQLIPALEIANKEKKPLVIITEDLDGEPLQALIVNKLKIGLPVVAIKAPGLGDYRKELLVDIAIATGGIVFEDDSNLINLEDCQLEGLGNISSVTVTKNSTLLLGGKGDAEIIKERIEQIKNEIPQARKNFEKIQLVERLSRLQSSVAIILVGGLSEVEVNEKKDRINDSLNSTRAAIEEGIVPGGGSALINCIAALRKLKPKNSDQALGINIIMNALRIPCATIASNAGYDGTVIVSKVETLGPNYGFDALNNEYVDMFQRGIIDPTKVVRRAITDASSIASLLTTAEAVVCDLDENNSDSKGKRPHKGDQEYSINNFREII